MSTHGRAADPSLWNIPKETRWTQNGGRRIGAGDVLLPEEVVVTGMGTRSHQTASCPALVEGRATAKANGYVTRGFFAVSYKIANRFVGPCKVCWSDPPPTLEDNPTSASDVPGTSGTASKRITTALRFEQLMLPPFCAANDDVPDDQASSQPGSSG